MSDVVAGSCGPTEPDLDAPARARAAVRAGLDGRVPPAKLDDVLLVMSELVNNAVLHGRGLVSFETELVGDQVVGEVADEGPGFAYEMSEPGLEALGGRGLLIVSKLTASWGVHEGTTHVWFAIDIEDDGRNSTVAVPA